jgi:hypothetical protein
MTNLKDNAAAAPRTTTRIPTASGDELEAWLYLPEGDGPHPAVVMAHGIGGIKAGGLAPFAERFREEGFVAIGLRLPQLRRFRPSRASARTTAPSSAGQLNSPYNRPRVRSLLGARPSPARQITSKNDYMRTF